MRTVLLLILLLTVNVSFAQSTFITVSDNNTIVEVALEMEVYYE